MALYIIKQSKHIGTIRWANIGINGILLAQPNKKCTQFWYPWAYRALNDMHAGSGSNTSHLKEVGSCYQTY